MCLPLHHSAFLKPCDHLATTAGFCLTPETTYFFIMSNLFNLMELYNYNNRCRKPSHDEAINIAETKKF